MEMIVLLTLKLNKPNLVRLVSRISGLELFLEADNNINRELGT